MISVREAATYLKKEYGVEVTPTSVINWIKREKLEGTKGTRWFTSQVAIDSAMASKMIPPKVGRQRRFSREQRTQMCKMRKSHSLKVIAKHFGCDESYVSLVCRGLR